jgi:putative sterol carrier protein
MSDPTISEFMSQMGAALIPEKAAGIDAVIQFKLSGAQAADYVVRIKDCTCTLTQGTDPAAKLTISADSTEFIKIFTGKIDPMMAFMGGKLKVTGDMSLGMKLMGLFKM